MLVSFLSAMIRKLAGDRWGFGGRSTALLVESNREVVSNNMRDALARMGRSGIDAAAAGHRMSEALSRLGPAARVAGVSEENLESMVCALDYAKPKANVVVAGTGMGGWPAPSVAQPEPEPEPEPKKERLLIRKIRFKRRGLL